MSYQRTLTFPQIRSQIKKGVGDLWDNDKVIILKENKNHATLIGIVDGKLVKRVYYGQVDAVDGAIGHLKHYLITGEWDEYDYYIIGITTPMKQTYKNTHHLVGTLIKFKYGTAGNVKKWQFVDKIHKDTPQLCLRQIGRQDNVEEPIL